jgi:hypothetical protein
LRLVCFSLGTSVAWRSRTCWLTSVEFTADGERILLKAPDRRALPHGIALIKESSARHAPAIDGLAGHSHFSHRRRSEVAAKFAVNAGAETVANADVKARRGHNDKRRNCDHAHPLEERIRRRCKHCSIRLLSRHDD